MYYFILWSILLSSSLYGCSSCKKENKADKYMRKTKPTTTDNKKPLKFVLSVFAKLTSEQQTTVRTYVQEHAQDIPLDEKKEVDCDGNTEHALVFDIEKVIWIRPCSKNYISFLHNLTAECLSCAVVAASLPAPTSSAKTAEPTESPK